MNFLKPYWLDKPIFFVMLFLIVFFLSSCATRRIEIQYYEGSLDDRLRDLKDIKSIKSTFSIEFDRGDGVIIRGDGILNLTEDTLDLQVYSMGFLVAEVKADQSGVKSNPVISKNRLTMIVDGLRNSFFWWDFKESSMRDEGEDLMLANSWKRLIIDKKTMLPLRMTIDTEDGRQLEVFYLEPSLINGFVFPSGIRIEFLKYAVNLRIKDISVQ